MSDQKKTTDLRTPYVHPSVDPRAAAYARGLAERKYSDPVAGGPTPPIPRLDQKHTDGMTMADQARAQRGPGSIFESADAPRPANTPYILPSDMLPPEATSDPAYQQGMGSGYASAQPELARKYGVIRNGQRLPAQMLNGGPNEKPQQGRLRKETIEGLKALQEAQKKADDTDLIAENESNNSPAGAATRIGSMPNAPNSPTPERAMTPDEIKKAVSQLDEFDLDQLHNMMVRDLLNNEEQRKIVEDRLEPMNLADLVMDGFVIQRVPVSVGEFEPSFRSLGGDDDLACKRLIVEEAKSLKVDDRYLLDKYAFMGLTCALYAINGKPLPDHRDKEGNFDDDLFWAKFRKVVRLPLPMLASLGVNYFWFDVRVRKLFVAKSVKNG